MGEASSVIRRAVLLGAALRLGRLTVPGWLVGGGPLLPARSRRPRSSAVRLEERGPTIELTRALASQIVGDHPLAEHWAKVWSERGVPFGAPVDCLTQRDDVTARLPEISVPALVIAGEHDHSIPIARQEQMRQHLTKATEVNIIAGAGHSPTATHPAQVNAVIEQFLVEAKPLG